MALYDITLNTKAHIFMLAENKSDAVYKSYKKVLEVTRISQKDFGFLKWERSVDSVDEIFTTKIDDKIFYIY